MAEYQDEFKRILDEEVQVRQDNVQIKLEIDGAQSRTELDNLTRKADVLREGTKGLKKGSQKYVAANRALSRVNARMKELRDEIGLTALTSGQLKAMAGQLNRELANLTPNTASFAAKAQELVNVENQLTQVRAEAKGVQQELSGAHDGVGDFIKKAVGFAGIQLGVEAVVGSVKEKRNKPGGLRYHRQVRNLQGGAHNGPRRQVGRAVCHAADCRLSRQNAFLGR